jgi:hypothetical protein
MVGVRPPFAAPAAVRAFRRRYKLCERLRAWRTKTIGSLIAAERALSMNASRAGHQYEWAQAVSIWFTSYSLFLPASAKVSVNADQT